jgi:hypothetical protein
MCKRERKRVGDRTREGMCKERQKFENVCMCMRKREREREREREERKSERVKE